MHGWRARIGLIVPSANTVNEPEFYARVPEGVSVHAARFRHERATVENQRAMAGKLDRPADLLATAEVDAVAFGCTTGSLVEGAGYAEEIEAKLRDLVGAPAVATAASVRRALDALGAGSVVVATPYPEELDEREAAFLGEAGYDVAAIGGVDIESAVAKADLHDTRAYREARELDRPEADAVFVSCTNYHTFEIVEALERDLGKPVVTSNQATLWDVLRAAGVDASGIELGRLFDLDA